MSKCLRLLVFLFATMAFVAITAPDATAAGKNVAAKKQAGAEQAPAHAPEETTQFPISLAILLVLVAVVGFAPAYHRLNQEDPSEGAPEHPHG